MPAREPKNCSIRFFFDHRIAENADAFDLDFDDIAGLEINWRVAARADAFGSAGNNERTRFQCGAATQKGDDFGHRKDHIARIALLDDFAIEAGGQREIVWILDTISRYEGGPEWTKSVEAFAPAPLRASPSFLPVARAHIVGDGIAENILQGARARDIFAFPSQDYPELAFEVNLIATQLARQDDGSVWVLQCRGTFQEDNGMLRNFRACFLGMLAIIKSNPIDGPWLGWRQHVEDVNTFIGNLHRPACDITTQRKKFFLII